MAFINKQEEVIKLRLTQYGKSLLSIGKFKPYYYAMFDDDIIYDSRYAGTTEHQNDAQDRIKDQARRDAQHVSVGVESRYGIATAEINAGTSEFTSLIYPPEDVENEKILGFCLTNMEIRTREAPRFDFNVYESEIENTQLEYDFMEGSRVRIPQLNFEPEHLLIRDSMAVDPFARDLGIGQGELIDSETFMVNPVANKIEFMDKSFLEHHPENIIFSLEEFNTPYLKENFEIEVFEVVEDGNGERLLPITDPASYFDITVEAGADTIPNIKNQRNGFFNN